MCCPSVKWTLGSTQQTLACGIAFQVYGSPCAARARIRCHGYNAADNCDTDCQIVAIEYCADATDPACEWTTDPGGCGAVFAELAAEISCYGDAEQPEAEYGLPRGNLFIQATQQQCAAQGGDYCQSPPCAEPCKLICPPGPTEWRIIDSNGVVWFAGDVEANPNATENLCYETNDCDSAFQPQWVFKDYPFIWENGFSGAEVTALYIGSSATLRLEVLGCATAGPATWTTVKGPTATTMPSACDSGSAQEWENQLSWLVLGTGCSTPAYYGQPTTSFWTVAPDRCECLLDPSTGLAVTYQDGEETKCRYCNNRIGGERGSGLEYLDHGMGVKYTNRNGDGDGSNLWNWEDDQGRYPAGWLPTETSFEGPEKTDSDVVIEGDMNYWRAYRRPPGFAPPRFRNVTITSPPGTGPLSRKEVTMGMIADAIIVDNAQLRSWFASPCYPNGYRPTFVVKDQITFTNGANARGVAIDPLGGNAPLAVFDTGFLDGLPDPLDPLQTVVSMDCIFKGQSFFQGGIINGNVTFEGSASMEGGAVPAIINGNATFLEQSYMNGANAVVNGDATFSDDTFMDYGDVTGTATFNDDACYYGTGGTGITGTFVPDPPPAC